MYDKQILRERYNKIKDKYIYLFKKLKDKLYKKLNVKEIKDYMQMKNLKAYQDKNSFLIYNK